MFASVPRLCLFTLIVMIIAASVTVTQPQAQAPVGQWQTLGDGQPPLPRHEHAYVKVGSRF